MLTASRESEWHMDLEPTHVLRRRGTLSVVDVMIFCGGIGFSLVPLSPADMGKIHQDRKVVFRGIAAHYSVVGSDVLFDMTPADGLSALIIGGAP